LFTPFTFPASTGSLGIVLRESAVVRTLIVEDSATFHELLKNILCARFPFMVFEHASDGEEAFQKVDAFGPDLIFMDIQLLGENGLEITKKVKRKVPRGDHDYPYES